MTAAYRLKGLGWFAGAVVVTLGFYLVSLQVAAERSRLSQVNAKIRAAERDIRALETEFDTRANLAQLERWNGDTLALVAPVAGQFVRSEAQLASISFTPSASGNPEMRTAQLVVPSLPDNAPFATVAPAPVPAIIEAPVTAPTPKLIQVAHTRASPASGPKLIPAAMTTLRAPVLARPQLVKASLTIALPKPTLRKAQAMAMLDSNLLSDTTLGDLASGARREKGRLN